MKTSDWVELTPVMLVPCTGCGALWQPDEACFICDDVPLTTNEESLHDIRSEGLRHD